LINAAGGDVLAHFSPRWVRICRERLGTGAIKQEQIIEDLAAASARVGRP
jgi:hypothetical protein